MVTASADFHPLRKLKQLAIELEAISFEGSVLFDLLSVNGLAENRFASINFSGHQFDKRSFAVESNINEIIKNEQDSMAKGDEIFLLGSVLSANEVETFRH